MNDDLEDRLRRTYRAVGDNTVAGDGDPPRTIRPSAVRPDSTRRWAGAALVAAVVLLLVGGLAVIDRAGPESPAASDGVHALPTWLPMPFGRPGAAAGGRPPLVSITSDADTDVIGYASEVLTVTIRVDRTGLDDLGGGLVEVRGGQVATFEGGDDAGRLRWNTSSGSTVAIEWVGPVFGGVGSIADVVDGLILVDDETWETATEFGGFTEDPETLQRRIGSYDAYVRGGIQSGMTFAIDGNNGINPWPCAVLNLGDFETWAVVSRFPSGKATVTWSDGTVASAELSRFVPGSAFGVGLAERPRFESGALPDVKCEGAS